MPLSLIDSQQRDSVMVMKTLTRLTIMCNDCVNTGDRE